MKNIIAGMLIGLAVYPGEVPATGTEAISA